MATAQEKRPSTPRARKTAPAGAEPRKRSEASARHRAGGRDGGHAGEHSHEGGPAHDHGHDHDALEAQAPAKPGRRRAPGIYLISPSGAVPEPKAVAKACARLGKLGYRTTVDRTALAVHERFAGTDKQRLAAVARAIRQPHRIVMATRGGYGLSRLLPHIDWKAVADSGKVFVGHSDFTLFNLALLARTGAESFTGPMAIYDFGGPRLDDLTADLFGEAMRGELEVLGFESMDADPVDARGVLWGGNLAVLASVVGTPYMPAVRKGILVLEDICEHPFRVERMLTHLLHAGILARQKAIVLGRFTDYRLGANDNSYDMPSVVAWLRANVKVPVVTGLPYGHVKVKATLPIGRKVGIATEHGMAHLVIDEHHH